MSEAQFTLPAVDATDDLVALLDGLKAGLTKYATDGSWEPAEYARTRKLLISHPVLRGKLPEFIYKCRTLGDFWGFIKGKYRHYQERRDFLAETLNPLIDLIEQGVDSFGQYEVGKLLGSGGFGMVYQAEHRLLNPPYSPARFSEHKAIA